MQRERLSRRMGFLLLSAGCAVGIGASLRSCDDDGAFPWPRRPEKSRRMYRFFAG